MLLHRKSKSHSKSHKSHRKSHGVKRVKVGDVLNFYNVATKTHERAKVKSIKKNVNGSRSAYAHSKHGNKLSQFVGK